VVDLFFGQGRFTGGQSNWPAAWQLPVFLILALFFLAVTTLRPAAVWAHPGLNKLIIDAPKAGDHLVVQGTVRVAGIADHPTFRKWQLDLIVGTDEAFIAWGEEPQPEPGLLAELNTQLYPDGDHKLRLRVVHSNLNYDEYFLNVTIANNGYQHAPAVEAVSIPAPEAVSIPAPEVVRAAPVAAPVPAPVAKPLPAVSAPAGNGLLLANTTLKGNVPIRGVANHERFRKWQVDLLLNGLPEQATHLEAKNVPVATEGDLFVFKTTEFPNGEHVLRLRVVHSNLNYDEYFVPVVIDQSASLPAAVGLINPPRISGGPSRWSGSGVRIGPNERRVIYLTFDDGPHSPYTEQIVELLSQHNAKATFFVVGRLAQANSDLIRNMYEAGHGIGNHTWNHRSLQGVSREIFTEEMSSTTRAVGKYMASCMRPPYGATDADTHTYASEIGYSVVMWSIETWDWKRPGASTIASRVINQAFPGAIVLLHDGGGNRSQTVSALEMILKELTAQGYSFEAFCR
jgi:peptidoglycan-N-acetylglucosamine deacetylase